MLVLSRKTGESIIIGGTVEVTVTEIRGDRVRLGFKAPAEVSIHREEVYRRIVKEQANTPAPPGKKGESRFFVECA